MTSVIDQMDAGDVKTMNLRIGQTQALLDQLKAERDAEVEAVRQRLASTPAEAEQFELMLDQIKAERTGRPLHEVRRARRQRAERDAGFARRLEEEASEPGRDYAE